MTSVMADRRRIDDMVVYGVLLVAVLGSAVEAAKFPSYIKRCARDDPQFNGCALASARAALSHFTGGDRALGMPPLDPLLVTRLSVEDRGSVGLNITLTDIRITGFAQTRLLDNFSLDIGDKPELRYEALVPRFELLSDYQMHGKVLILPISGQGKANITLVNMKMKVISSFSVVTRDNGKKYLQLEPVVLTTQAEMAYFDFTNLFNGDPLLGPQTNLFLNENWKLLVDDVGPTMGQGISAGIERSVQTLVDKFSYDELVPPTLSA